VFVVVLQVSDISMQSPKDIVLVNYFFENAIKMLE